MDIIVMLLAGMALFGIVAYLFFVYDQRRANRSSRP